jgi:hypothetical protein
VVAAECDAPEVLAWSGKMPLVPKFEAQMEWAHAQ